MRLRCKRSACALNAGGSNPPHPTTPHHEESCWPSATRLPRQLLVGVGLAQDAPSRRVHGEDSAPRGLRPALLSEPSGQAPERRLRLGGPVGPQLDPVAGLLEGPGLQSSQKLEGAPRKGPLNDRGAPRPCKLCGQPGCGCWLRGHKNSRENSRTDFVMLMLCDADVCLVQCQPSRVRLGAYAPKPDWGCTTRRCQPSSNH